MSPLLLCLIIFIRHCLSGCGAEDSTLNIIKKCGEPYSIGSTYDSTERQTYIYIPTALCDDDAFTKLVKTKTSVESFDVSKNQLTIPMMVAIHCLGCSPSHELSKWQSFAEEFTFILLAPQGIGSSWNADQCCDPAVADSVDDIGFLQTVINGAQTSMKSVFPFVTVSNKNYDGYVWVTGFSNGGFMADKLAWASSVNQFSKLVAVAPMAGYIYDRTKYTKNSVKHKDKHNGVAMYFHHSKSDGMVNPNGCCMDNGKGCCCGIAQKSLTCLSVYSEYNQWLRWNGCNEDITFEKLLNEEIIHNNADKSVAMSCARATPNEHGCDVMTSLCMYDKVHHTEWANKMPQTRNIMLFFLKSLCVQQNGVFNEVTMKCQCTEDSMFDGLYCITPKKALGMDVGDAKVKEIAVLTNVKKKGEKVIEKKEVKMEEKMKNQEEKIEKKLGMDERSIKLKNVMRNGKMRHKMDKLSLVGNARNKYINGDFELDMIENEEDMIDSWTTIPNTSIVLICSMIFSALGLFVMCSRKQSGYQYSKVRLNDEEDESTDLMMSHTS